MITRYLNKPIPHHVIYAVGFLGGLSFIFFTVSLTTNSTLANRLLFFGIICGLIVFFLHRQNHLLEKNVSINKSTEEAINVSKIQDFNRAATKLKSSLSEAENWLKFIFPKGSDIKVAGKLKEFDPAHPKALMEFRAHIPENRQTEFDRACQKYYYPNPNSDQKRPFFQYALPDISADAHTIALNNIKDILHFTDPKNVFK